MTLDPTAGAPDGPRHAAPPTAPTSLSDGEWHRLHPATPLLKGGIAFIAILGIVITNLRERLIEVAFGGNGEYEGDPIDMIVNEGLVGIALLIVTGGLLLFIAGFYASWRMHTFRITEERVEVRSGILFRTNRQGRLDRIQGINIVRPFIARLFGAARLEINVAGQDANVQLAYLSSSAADALRREILRLASGTQNVAVAATVTAASGVGSAAGTVAGVAADPTLIEKRVTELLAPELDPDLAPPESVVSMHTGRLAGSIALSDTSIILVLIVGATIVWSAVAGEFLVIFWIIPTIIGMGSFLVSRFTKSLRYSIAGTPDGVRVGFGLFSTSNETLPPGRIHSIQVSQPLLWRPFGWWEIKVNRASHSSTQGASGQQNTTILPVGSTDDVRRVLSLLAPSLADDGSIDFVVASLVSKGGDDGFVNSPKRAQPIRWFSWRRNGFALVPGMVVLRKGAIWREIMIVPAARAQSVAVHQGPLLRRMKLAMVQVHTVAGPISARLGAVDADAARTFFAAVTTAAITSARSDTTHRWRSSEVAQ